MNEQTVVLIVVLSCIFFFLILLFLFLILRFTWRAKRSIRTPGMDARLARLDSAREREDRWKSSDRGSSRGRGNSRAGSVIVVGEMGELPDKLVHDEEDVQIARSQIGEWGTVHSDGTVSYLNGWFGLNSPNTSISRSQGNHRRLEGERLEEEAWEGRSDSEDDEEYKGYQGVSSGRTAEIEQSQGNRFDQDERV